MKLHILSDLHLEFDNYALELPKVDAEVLILAGDIGLGSKHREWVLNLSDRYKYIMLIAGNHEYYQQNYDKLRKSWSKISNSWNNDSKGAHILFFDPGVTQIGDYTFVGATLWTSFDNGNPNVINKAQYGMNDYRLIKDYEEGIEPPRILSPWIVLEQHRNDVAFLERQIRSVDKTNPHNKLVVITHHAPSHESIAADYRNSRDHLINFCYHTPLDHLVAKTDLWIHGHTHTSMDYRIENARVVCNPRGYFNHNENPAFQKDFVIEV